MATTSPHDTSFGATTEAAATVEGLGATVVSWVQSVVCGLSGHDNLLQFARGRMFLRCVSCGHESPGWDVRPRATHPPAEAAPKRRRLLPQLAARRAA